MDASVTETCLAIAGFLERLTQTGPGPLRRTRPHGKELRGHVWLTPDLRSAVSSLLRLSQRPASCVSTGRLSIIALSSV